MEKINQAVGEKNKFDNSGGEGGGQCIFYKERVLEMYWVHSIYSYLCG